LFLYIFERFFTSADTTELSRRRLQGVKSSWQQRQPVAVRHRRINAFPQDRK